MLSLDDLQNMQNIDKADMYHKIIHLPEEILNTYEKAEVNIPKTWKGLAEIDHIVFCGMGGSAVAADIAKAVFSKNLFIEVIKDYDLPKISEQSLVIVISYSGNTEETISCFEQAMSKTKQIAAVTSGGKIKTMLTGKFPWIEVDAGFPPRAAIARLFFSLVKLLEYFQLIPPQTKKVKSLIAQLIKKAGSIADNVPIKKNLAKDSALSIKGKIPIIYSQNPDFYPIAYRWKCQFNENSKYPAFCHTFPEMNHNEIEAWEVKGFENMFIPIFLSTMQNDGQLAQRKTLLKNLFKQQSIEYLEFFVEGESVIEQIFSLIYLGDMISYYLAVLLKVDPSSIKFIDYLKENL